MLFFSFKCFVSPRTSILLSFSLLNACLCGVNFDSVISSPRTPPRLLFCLQMTSAWVCQCTVCACPEVPSFLSAFCLWMVGVWVLIPPHTHIGIIIILGCHCLIIHFFLLKLLFEFGSFLCWWWW